MAIRADALAAIPVVGALPAPSRLRLLKLYAAGVAAVAGLVAMRLAAEPAARAPGDHWPLVAVLMTLTAGAAAAPVRLGPHQRLVVDDALHVVALLLLGPGPAMVVAGAGTVLGKLARAAQGHRDWWALLFNAGKSALAVGLSGAMAWQVAGAPLLAAEGEWSPKRLGGLLVALAALYVVGTFPASLAAAIQGGAPPLRVWLAARRVDWIQTASLFAAGTGVALAAAERPWIVLLVALPTAAAHYTLRQLNALHERRLAEQAHAAALARARLEGALMMSRTAAHEINNALVPVVGLSEVLALHPRVAEDPQLRALVQQIAQGGVAVAERVGCLERIVRLKEDERFAACEIPVLDLDASATPDAA